MLFSNNGFTIKEAEKAFQNKQFNKAKELYQRAYERSSDRSEKTKISFQMANCARLMGKFKVAESYYKRTIKLRYFEMFSDPNWTPKFSQNSLNNLLKLRGDFGSSKCPVFEPLPADAGIRLPHADKRRQALSAGWLFQRSGHLAAHSHALHQPRHDGPETDPL